jgi:hypothetical protein
MNEQRDPFISTLFAQQERHWADQEFLQQILHRIDSQRRQQLLLSIALGVVAIASSWLMAPMIVQCLATIFNAASTALMTITTGVQSPTTQLVGLALIVTLSPILVIWRLFR